MLIFPGVRRTTRRKEQVRNYFEYLCRYPENVNLPRTFFSGSLNYYTIKP